jgi:hypothetical protein
MTQSLTIGFGAEKRNTPSTADELTVKGLNHVSKDCFGIRRSSEASNKVSEGGVSVLIWKLQGVLSTTVVRSKAVITAES